MVALAYDNLGGVGGLGANAPVAYSSRGRGRDRYETFTFTCSKASPFSGTVEFQASVAPPPTRQGKSYHESWASLVSMDFYGERDVIFIESQIEAAEIRVKCVRYDENVSISANHGVVLKQGGKFKIDGVEIFAKAGNTVADIAALVELEGIPNITTSTILVMDSVIITKTDGTEMTLEETAGSPLKELGIFTHADEGIVTLSPSGAISSIMGMR